MSEPEKTLVINHQIYLTREQRNLLLKEKTPIQVVGVSVPVWFDKGKTNEPAHEVFCQYTITNEPQEMVIAALPVGYRINLPQPKPQPEVEFRSILDEEQEKPLNPMKLGDPDDGGGGWFKFKQMQTIKDKGRTLNVLHYVELKDFEYLYDSLTEKRSIAETSPSAC